MNLAETRFGVARGRKSVVAFNAALAVGSSFYFNEALIRGRDFSAGLLGAQTAAGGQGGEEGLAADKAGGWAVLADVDAGAAPQDRTRQSFEAAKRLMGLMDRALSGDARAAAALHRAGTALGRIINLAVAFLHPDAAIVSGPLARSPDYVAGVRAAMHPTDPLDSHPVELFVSQMTGQAAARWLAIDEFLTRRPLDLSRLWEREVA